MTANRTTRATAAAMALVIVVTLCVFGEETPSRVAHVTYVTANSVYVDAGVEDGVAQGDRMQVIRAGAVIADLEVTVIASGKAVCHRRTATAAVQVGDEVRFVPNFTARPPQPVAKPAAAIPVPRPEKKPADPLAALGLRGRIGLRYLSVTQADGPGLAYHQPSFDVRLTGTHAFGTPLDFGLDLRALRTYRTLGDGSSQNEGRTRFYSAFLAWQPAGSAFRFSLGRQFSPSLAAVNLFDGALLEYRKDGFAAGAFTGTEPDPLTWGFSSDVRQHGAFVEFGSHIGAERRWAVTAGAVGSYAKGEINREFAFLQGRYDDRKLSVYMVGEVDVNRGWRKEAEGKSYDLASAFVSARYRFGDVLSVDAGFDDRRNVRLYRDFISPETEFDDKYRRGTWVGADLRLGQHVVTGANARRSDDGQGNNADSYTAFFGLRQLTPWGLDVRARSTHYTNERLDGWMHSLSVSGELTDWSQLELHAGTRRETVRDLSVPSGSLNWFGFDWDVFLRRHWLLILSAERTRGQSEGTDQVYATVSYRF